MTNDWSIFEFMDGETTTFLPWEMGFNFNGQCVVLTTASGTPFSYNDLDCANLKTFSLL